MIQIQSSGNSPLSDWLSIHMCLTGREHKFRVAGIQEEKNVINLDTGCVYSNMTGYGTLTAIELNTRSLYFA